MQRTASKAAIDVLGICHPPVGCVAPLPGLAVADLCLVRQLLRFPMMTTNDGFAEIISLIAAHCSEVRGTLSAEQLNQLKSIPADELSVRTHFGLAQNIRNRWLNNKTSPLMAAFQRGDLSPDPDNISELLVAALWRDLRCDKLTDAELRDLLHEHFLFTDEPIA
jgi:hypothetical protein